MSRGTGCIVYPGPWLKGAIIQPVLQDGTGNLSWAFLAWAWAGFKGGMSIMSSEVSPGMQKVTQHARPPATMQRQQKSWGEPGGAVRDLGHGSGHFPQQPSCPLEARSGTSYTMNVLNQSSDTGQSPPLAAKGKVLGSSH